MLAAEGQLVPHSHYQRANTDWLARCRFGIGTHWTAQTVPRNGPPKPFQKAVDNFDLDRFIKTVEDAGADYVLFTSAHALQMLPAPHPVLDKILPGRTCKRDLIRELADGLTAKGKHFLVYYNHSCNHNQDPEWERAVGYHARNKERFAQNIMDIVGHMGEQVIGFVRTCNKHMAPMTFNVGIYQDGTMAAESVEQLRRLIVALG